MKLVLSCFCCGSIEFKRTKQPCTEIENTSYLLQSDIQDAKVICEKCELEDWVENLVITFN